MRNQQQDRQRARSRSRSRNRNRSRSRFARQVLPSLRKEVTVVKTDTILGITVSDSPSGMVYIRRIRPNTICAQMPEQIRIGDQIEKVNGESMVGKRHFQVARLLRSIPVGRMIDLVLVSTEESVTSPVAFTPIVEAPIAVTPIVRVPIVETKVAEKIEEKPIVPEPVPVKELPKPEVSVQEDSPSKKLIECINKVFEDYLGFDDDDLALSVWNLASGCTNLLEMSTRIRDSAELSQFEFPEDLIFDMWGIVDDFKHKRLNQTEAGQNVD